MAALVHWVQVRLCPSHALQLNYRKNKEVLKAQHKEHKRHLRQQKEKRKRHKRDHEHDLEIVSQADGDEPERVPDSIGDASRCDASSDAIAGSASDGLLGADEGVLQQVTQPSSGTSMAVRADDSKHSGKPIAAAAGADGRTDRADEYPHALSELLDDSAVLKGLLM